MINYGAQFFKLTSYEIKMLYFSIKHMQFPLPLQVKNCFLPTASRGRYMFSDDYQVFQMILICDIVFGRIYSGFI